MKHDADGMTRYINCVFPIDRLRELAAEGMIGGVSDKHLGFMGWSQDFRDTGRAATHFLPEGVQAGPFPWWATSA